MPAVSSEDLTRLRSSPHATKLYLVVYHPATIWTARVDGDQARGEQSIPVTSVSETRTPRQHFLTLFGKTAGRDQRGFARFRGYDAGVLTVSPHNAVLMDGDYITVLEEVKPAAIIPKLGASGAISEDGNLTYSDQNVKYQPISGFGPPAVGFIDTGTGLATFQFFAYAKAFADGATMDTWAWAFTSAATPTSASVQGSSASPISVDFPAGQYYIRLTATDSNGKLHRTYRPAFALDRSDHSQYYDQLEISGMEGNVEQGGWSVEVKVYGDATEDEFPPQALCVVFAEDWYAGENVSIGGDYKYRENVVFVGYVRENSISKQSVGGSVSFTLDGIGKLMDNMLSFPCNLLSTSGTPANWHELKNLNFDRAAHHVVTQHSTLDLCADIVFDTKQYSIASVDLTESSLRDQLNEQLYTAVRARVASSRTGRLYFVSYPLLFPDSERPSTVILSATKQDWLNEIDLGAERHEKAVAQVDFAGFTFDGVDPIAFWSLSPPAQWSTGSVEKVDGIRADDQGETNAIAGIWEGWLNADFKEIVVNWRGNYRVFDIVPPERVRLTLAAADNQRGLNWTNKPCWITNVAFNFQNGSQLLVTTGLEKNSGGRIGISNTSDIDGAPDDDDDVDVIEPPPGIPPGGILIDPPGPIVSLPPPGPATPGPDAANAPYDILDGYNGDIASSETLELLYGETSRAFVITAVSVYSPDADVTLILAVAGSTVITVTRSGGAWTINGSSAGSSDTVANFALGTPISVASGGLLFRTAVTADGAVTGIAYGFRGYTA